jgi:hypothetical protein
MSQARPPRRNRPRNAAPGANVIFRQLSIPGFDQAIPKLRSVAPANLFLMRAGAKARPLASNR